MKGPCFLTLLAGSGNSAMLCDFAGKAYRCRAESGADMYICKGTQRYGYRTGFGLLDTLRYCVTVIKI